MKTSTKFNLPLFCFVTVCPILDCACLGEEIDWRSLILEGLPNNVPAFVAEWKAIRKVMPNPMIDEIIVKQHEKELITNSQAIVDKELYKQYQNKEREAFRNGFEIPIEVKLSYIRSNEFFIERLYDGKMWTRFYSGADGFAYRVEELNRTVHIFDENNSFIEQLGRGLPILGVSRRMIGFGDFELAKEDEEKLFFVASGGKVTSVHEFAKAGLAYLKWTVGYTKDYDAKECKFNANLAEFIIKNVREIDVVAVPGGVEFKEFNADGSLKKIEVWELKDFRVVKEDLIKPLTVHTFEKGYLVTDFSDDTKREFMSDEIYHEESDKK
jgi:hypothetical protein